jgi:thiamine biosynthesis lipoprotein
MSETWLTRRGALRLAMGGAAVAAAGNPAEARLFRRLGVAFGTTVSVKVEARDERSAERLFSAAFAEIRRVDRVASLTDPGGDLFRLNRDGFLDRPDSALVEMLRVAGDMHEATRGAFDVTIQPLWLAMDRAARRGAWLTDAELRSCRALVDQSAVRVAEDRISFARPGMQITLNSLARGLTADRVAAALRRLGVRRAFFDTDVLGSMGPAPSGASWRAGVRHPRRADAFVAFAELDGCLATSGDYQYFWSPDYQRHHIVDPRSGVSPRDFSSVSVLAASGLTADALSTAAFLAGTDARALLKTFGAEALFVDKAGGVSATAGFPQVGA